MSFVPPPARAGKLSTTRDTRPSTPVAIYAPDAPRALFIVGGVSPAELANLDTRELARIARREAA